MLCSVKRRHLNCGNWLKSLCDRMSYNAIHMPVIDQRSGMTVIGTKDEIAGVEPLLGYRLDLACNVVPGRAQAQHRAHTLAHACHRIFHSRAFMIVFGTTSHIAMESAPQLR